MNNKYIIQISTSPIDPNDLEVNDWKLDKFFFDQNPWELGRIIDVDRKETLNYLKDEMPNGCALDPDNETIEILNGLDYVKETVERMFFDSIDKIDEIFGSPFYWWKRTVCMFGDILVYFENGELFTLPEFLFYAIENGFQKLYIGTVYQYDF